MSVVFISHAKDAMTGMSSAKATALEMIGGRAETHAKKLCPVNTGRLRASITHQQYDDDTEVIGTNVSYAPYVELGTTRMHARAFLRPAVDGHQAEYIAIMKQCMGGP